MGRLAERWQAVLDHPILRLELRRIRRQRWWPGRRFFLFYPALLGAALGYGVALAVNHSLGVQVTAIATGAPVACLLSVVTWLLSFALPWIAPALTAATIAHERELGTFDLLRATLLTERSIVLGKLGGCLARLWPGILILVLLTPFQTIWVIGGSLLGGPFSPQLIMVAESDTKWLWLWLLLSSVPGLLKPWCDLALNAAVGLFVSAISHSSGLAIAASYGAVLIVRIALWLAMTTLWPLLLLLVVGAQTTPEPETMPIAFGIAGLMPLAMVLVEVAGAAILIWGATWWLKRM